MKPMKIKLKNAKAVNRKLEMVQALTERRRFSTQFRGALAEKHLKEITAWERKTAKRLTEGQILELEEAMKRERLKRRYDTGYTQPPEDQMAKIEREARKENRLDVKAAIKRTNRVIIKLRRKAKRMHKKPQVYSLKAVQQAFPEYLKFTNKDCDLKKTYRDKKGRKLTPEQIMKRKAKVTKKVIVW